MDELTDSQTAVLKTLDKQIGLLEEKLEEVQPLLNELNKLRQTRRVLLSERSTTGGGGGTRQKLSMEEVVKVLSDSDEGMTPQDIAKALGAPDGTVRSHLSRNKGERYTKVGELWFLTEEAPDA